MGRSACGFAGASRYRTICGGSAGLERLLRAYDWRASRHQRRSYLSFPGNSPPAYLTTSEPRYELMAEINEVDKHLTQLVSFVAPKTLALPQVGPVNVAQLLITAGENFDRFRNEAAFARLCGVEPTPVSSGKSHRMRLHGGGNRQANRVIYLIAICRLRYDPRSQAYRDRKRAQGHPSADVIRCLKRFIAREIYYRLKRDLS